MGVFKVWAQVAGGLVGEAFMGENKEVLAALRMMDSGDVASFTLVQGSGG